MVKASVREDVEGAMSLEGKVSVELERWLGAEQMGRGDCASRDGFRYMEQGSVDCQTRLSVNTFL